MNVAAGLAHDGSLVVLASGWNRRKKPGDYSNPHEGEALIPWVCRSSDGGQTWEHTESITLPDEEGYRGIPFGDIARHTDGTLGACIYGGSKGGHHSRYYSSDDDGRSWKVKGMVEGINSNETTPLVLDDGSVLVAARTQVNQRIELHRSADQGANWLPMGPVSMIGQIPGHLLALEDGRILLSYGLRNKGLHGVAVRLSSDQGRTWGAPQVIVNYHTDTDGGYLSSVQVGDGTIVTAYYCKGIETHQRYHMGVVRWTADAPHNARSAQPVVRGPPGNRLRH